MIYRNIIVFLLLIAAGTLLAGYVSDKIGKTNTLLIAGIANPILAWVFLNTGNLDLKKSRSEVVGDDPSEMVENLPDYPEEYLWPSDHAGVVSRLMFF